jgi:MFS transporter, PPP family, 3-phenylpropionic acid transporter
MKKTFNGELITIIIIMGLATMAMAVLNPILPLYLKANSIVPSVIGLMLSAGMIGMVFGESSGGWLADKVGLKTPMSIGTFLCAPLVLCFVFVTGAPTLFLVFIFWGLIRAAIFGPARGYIGNKAGNENKATIIAIYMTCITISRSLGSLISGFVADSRWAYEGDFYLSAGLSVLAGILVFIGLKKMPLWKTAKHKGTQTAGSPIPLIKAPVKYRPVVFQSIIAMLFFLAIGVNSFLPLLVTDVVKETASKLGILYTIGGLVSTVLFIPMGRLADSKNKKTLIIIGMLLSALNMAGLAFAREYWMLIGLQIVGNIGFAMFTPAAVALLSNNVPGYWQGTAMGVYGAAEDVGIIIGSGVGGFIWTAGGPTALYLMGCAAGVVGAFVCLGFVKDLTVKSKSELKQPI